MIIEPNRLTKVRSLEPAACKDGMWLQDAKPDDVLDHANERVAKLEGDIVDLQECLKEKRKELREWKKILGRK